MSIQTPKRKYNFFAKFFHWGFVLLFIYGVAKQVNEIEQLEDQFFFQFEIIFAVIFLFLLSIRFVYMNKTQETSLPDDTSKIQKIAARTVHLGMYSTLAGTAITGLLIGLFYWLGFKDGLLIDLLTAIHSFVVNALYWLIGIHIVAAVYHRIKKDGVWSSMVPFLKEK
ncbi:cytochrome b/b6 domain-containing protein [Alphaproteobacteria bacterium]|nr:cytochrome b/b6 domain-containing protein [Alphaproteobacteria bacterium]